MTRLTVRKAPLVLEQRLVREGVHPLLSRLYAARGVGSAAEVDIALERLVPPGQLRNADAAARFLADAIAAAKRLLIVADYDCDGATACAVGMRALAAFGATVEYLVPDRFVLGYGLTPELVALAAARRPDVIVTVDNGIASVDGVAAASALGIATVITDHHLPGETLPAATVIVNPNQPGDAFPSKAIAGVGVMFYVMLALRAELRRRNAFADRPEPNLAALLDLVALGTVADVVRLDANNRVLVSQGLRRIRAGRMQPGIAALFAVAGRDARRATAFDLGFALGPRLNAAGRLADMSLGIECLVTENMERALAIARQLDDLNRERRDIESGMIESAEGLLADLDVERRASVALFDPGWHQGVVGILASRIRERTHRPTFAFAPSDGGELRGSGRSIPGFHLRDALDLVSKRDPGLIRRFGGHAAAAGLTLAAADLARFRDAFEGVARELAGPELFRRTLETDGPLDAAYFNLDTVRMLDEPVWGQGFPQPLFADEFVVESQRLVGEKHLKLKLAKDGRSLSAIHFRREAPLPARVRAAYRLAIDEWNGAQSVQLVVEHAEAAA
ncbi:MAG: single-stranded-DNA-specific exonuclease RecJ [Burkholderiales bacterium]|jgi:single-stranded-DNA-specific exonuclease|nr:single-stranded-DNA-specific exonuclease RecJ [Burkholderiales bacterium]